MVFNFSDKYKDYSNIELLKIIRRPDDYQPAAIEAAGLILKHRQITEEEKNFVEEFYKAISEKKAVSKARIDFYKDKSLDFLEPVLHPGKPVSAVKWLNILLLVIS